MGTEIVVAGLAGGFAGLLASVALHPGAQLTSTDTIAILAGAAIAIGIDRHLRS